MKATKDHGIYFWRKSPRDDLPKGNIPTLIHPNNYTEKRQTSQQTIIQSFVDSDHASASDHRRSVSGFHCQLAGGVVLYKTQVQSIVAQSSTEAEFIAASEAGKSILYLRTIMQEIGLEQHDANVLFEDNQGALLMAQAGQPTKRTKHIEIKHYALQQWVQQDLITFHRISTSDNSADTLTKATPRTLFYRHNNFIMGRVIPNYVKFVSQKHQPLSQKKSVHQIHTIALNIYLDGYDKRHTEFSAGGDVIR